MSVRSGPGLMTPASAGVGPAFILSARPPLVDDAVRSLHCFHPIRRVVASPSHIQEESHVRP
jgi:hypothetical protein